MLRLARRLPAVGTRRVATHASATGCPPRSRGGVAVWGRCRSLSTTAAADHSRGPLPLFEELVERGELRGGDGRQLAALLPLQRLFEEIVAEAAAAPTQQPAADSGGGGGWFGWSDAPAEPASRGRAAAQGVYTHGGVGCGKTMLMNLFADCLHEECPTLPVTQTHFSAFMLDVHRRMHALKQLDPRADVVPAVVEDLLGSEQGVGTISGVLCFDEFQVTDIADAMVLKQIFELLFAGGMVVVATSNRPPQDLYLNGEQREFFLPFIDVLCDHCQVEDVEVRDPTNCCSALPERGVCAGRWVWTIASSAPRRRTRPTSPWTSRKGSRRSGCG